VTDHELLTIDEASTLLRVRPPTLRAWMRQRRIAYLKLGRLVRFRKKDLEAFIDKACVPPQQARSTHAGHGSTGGSDDGPVHSARPESPTVAGQAPRAAIRTRGGRQ
jgi:excisionase family DNA binding protein